MSEHPSKKLKTGTGEALRKGNASKEDEDRGATEEVRRAYISINIRDVCLTDHKSEP